MVVMATWKLGDMLTLDQGTSEIAYAPNKKNNPLFEDKMRYKKFEIGKLYKCVVHTHNL